MPSTVAFSTVIPLITVPRAHAIYNDAVAPPGRVDERVLSRSMERQRRRDHHLFGIGAASDVDASTRRAIELTNHSKPSHKPCRSKMRIQPT
jgi:hypothetical protein